MFYMYLFYRSNVEVTLWRIRVSRREPRRYSFLFPYEKIWNNQRKWKTVQWNSS